MKKISLLLISLLLALTLLAGCAAPNYSTIFAVTETPSPDRDGFDSFEDIEYARPDFEAIQNTVLELFEALDSPFRFKQISPLLDEFYAQCTNFDTMYVLAYIRSCKDMTDEFYSEEYSWLMSVDASVQLLIEQVYTACADSIHAFWLEPLKFWDGFREEYKSREGETEPDSLRYGELAARKAELLSLYRSIISEATIELAGQEMSFDEYILQLPPYAQAEAYEKHYRENNKKLGEIYIELISIHREMAGLMGYESYAAMEYELGYGRDYDPEQAREYMEHVKRYLAPLGRMITQQALSYAAEYRSVTSRELLLWLETAAEGFGGSIEEAYNYMRAHQLYDMQYSPNKMNSSFQTYLPDYDAPYLFIDPNGDNWDIITVFHEFGHYADSYMRYNAYESLDLSESFSQAMEFLALSELDCILNAQELEQMHFMTVLDITDTMLEQSALAEFELLAHEMQQPTLEKLNELWMRLTQDYGIYDESIDYAYRYAWTETPHLFENPFYVISYPVSAAVALELYELELEDEGAGIERFVEMSQSRLAGLVEAVDFAALQHPMSEERVMDMAEFLEGLLVK